MHVNHVPNSTFISEHAQSAARKLHSTQGPHKAGHTPHHPVSTTHITILIPDRHCCQWVAPDLLLHLTLSHPVSMEPIWNTSRQLDNSQRLTVHCQSIPDHQTATTAASSSSSKGRLIMNICDEVAIIFTGAKLGVLIPAKAVSIAVWRRRS